MAVTLVELSPQALRVLLAAVFFDSTFFRRFWPLLTPDFWADRYYNAIAVFVDEFFRTYAHVPDFEVVVDFFAVDPSIPGEQREVYAQVFDDLLTAPLSDLPFYIDHLRTFIRRGAFASALATAEQALEANKFDDILKEITEANLVAVERDFGTIGYFTESAVDGRTDRRLDPSNIHARRIPCVIGNLDSYLRGGLPPSTLTVFVGATGVGKSNALVHCARMAVLYGFKVVYVTLELEPETVADRFDSAFSGVAHDHLIDMAGEVRRRLNTTFAKYGDSLRIVGYPETTLTPDQLDAMIEVLKRDSGFAPDAVMVDYADLMKPPRSYKDRRFELNAIYTSLHKTAKQFKIAVVTATQAKRDAIGKKIVGLADISEDISKAWIADHIFGICQTTEEAARNKARLFVAKNRSGKPFQEISFDQDYSICTFAKPGFHHARTIPVAEALSLPLSLTTTVEKEVEEFDET